MKARLVHQGIELVDLLGRGLQQEPAVCRELLRRGADQPLRKGRPVPPPAQRNLGLRPADLAHALHLVVAEVRGICGDDVEGSRHALQEVGDEEVHPPTQQLLRIQAEDNARFRGQVRGAHLQARHSPLEGNADAPRARAGIVQPEKPRVGADHVQRFFHEGLGVRPGDQHAFVNVELQAPELLDPADVGHRGACRAAIHQGNEATFDLGANLVGQRRKDSLLRRLQGEGQQQQGVQERCIDLREKQLVIPLTQQGADGHVLSDVSADSCALTRRASTNSSISPFITASSLYRVRLMRWSVARFCGKL